MKEDAEGSQVEKERVFYLSSEGALSREAKEPSKESNGRGKQEKGPGIA